MEDCLYQHRFRRLMFLWMNFPELTYQETAYQSNEPPFLLTLKRRAAPCINRAYDKFDTDVIAPLKGKLTGHIIWNFPWSYSAFKTWHFPFCHIL